MRLQGLKAWISYPGGEDLFEYPAYNNNNECWIISEGGRNFIVNWQVDKDEVRNSKTAARNGRKGWGLGCTPWLDGEEMTMQVLGPKEIQANRFGEIAEEDNCRFIFGMNLITDDENEACPTEVFTDINTIRIFLQWLPGYTEYQVLHQTTQMDLDEESDETRDKEPARRSVHERVAKDAHPGSAQLEKPERSTHRPHKSGNHLKKYYRFNRAKAAHIPPIEFVFHYGPKEFLKAKGKLDLKKTGTRVSARTAARDASASASTLSSSLSSTLQVGHKPKEEPADIGFINPSSETGPPNTSAPEVEHVNDAHMSLRFPSPEPKEEEDDEFVDPPSPPVYDPDYSDIEFIAYSEGHNAPKIMVSPANGPEPDPRRSAPPFPQVEATNSVESSLSPIPLPQAKEPPKEESASIGLLNANGEDESDVEFVDPPPESRPPDAPAPKVEYNISYPAPNLAGKRRRSPEDLDPYSKIRTLTAELNAARDSNARLQELADMRRQRISELLIEMEKLREESRLMSLRARGANNQTGKGKGRPE